MSLFQSLFPLARHTTLTVLITAEGNLLRVNVTPHPKSERGKDEKALYPLSLLATPEELDAEFAQAVALYEPGAASVLDQARAIAAANGGNAEKPASAEGAKRRRGRAPKNAAAQNSADESATGPTENDLRQMDLVDENAAQTSAASDDGNSNDADNGIDTW